ncbi:MAG: cupin domain-containing protein [Candidatus Omnitrophica bacterium]|nr:cupin domain-containing protein [Candidatus Omnitrophota bacterium]
MSKKILKDMIQVQEGSVVSREIVKRGDAGTVSLFAFDQGQGLSEHTAPFEAFVYIVEGRARVRIGTESQELNAGEALILPAHKPHAVEAVEKFKMLLVLVKNE